jgi:hypothetical protein
MDEVRLPDLEVIRRFSIAVRSEHAPVEEVVEALQTDLERIEKALRRRAPRRTSPASSRASSRRSPSRKSPSRRKPSARAKPKAARSRRRW